MQAPTTTVRISEKTKTTENIRLVLVATQKHEREKKERRTQKKNETCFVAHAARCTQEAQGEAQQPTAAELFKLSAEDKGRKDSEDQRGCGKSV